MKMQWRRALIAAVVATTLAAAPGRAAAQDPPVVQTNSGAVQGFRAAPGVDGFLGVPYAAPPVQALRWRAPQPAAAWTGVRDATRYGNACPAVAGQNGPRSENEDCLFVNVWRPSALPAGSTRPVYVFIHGGGLNSGRSDQADMAAIVEQTGVVAVSFNYRVGPLGFLSAPGLTREAGDSGNYGLLDQQAALRWVRDNIQAFSGRPGDVTVGGHSAGAWSVCAHLVAPGSQGLFSQAMMQSGACPSRTQGQSDAYWSAFATNLGCADTARQAACLRSVPAGTLIDAAPTAPRPVRGTALLPQDPRQAIARGGFAHVPVVVGATRDEGRAFAYGYMGAARAQYVDWIDRSFSAHDDAVLARYPWPASSNRTTAPYLIGAIVTDGARVGGIGGCANLRLTEDLARFTRTYAYEFNNRTGPGPLAISGYVWGAGHAAELAYLFPRFDYGAPITPRFDAGDERLADEMKGSWGAFVRYGDPDVTGYPHWPAFDLTRRVMSLRAGDDSVAGSTLNVRREHYCDFWDGL